MTVQTRNVYYFSGFDPRGAAYYLRLFRAELRKSGLNVSTPSAGSPHRSDPLSQPIHAVVAGKSASPDGAPTAHARLNLYLMKWDDIVRKHWPTSTWALLTAGLQVYRTGLANLSLRKIWRISHGAFWAGLLPLLFFAIALFTLALIFWLTKVIIDEALPASSYSLPLLSAFLAACVVILVAGKLPTIAEKTGVFWLIRIFRFNLQLAAAKLPETVERQRAWAESIIRRQTDNPSDEVVLLGHSVGTIVMLEVARKLLNDPRWRAIMGTRPTKLLTLGNCIPFVALHPEAEDFRQTLRVLSRCEHIQWWDITAKVDPLCFFLSSPMGETSQKKRMADKPVLRVARFFRMYAPEKWKRMRRNKLHLHFLYLMTPDIDHDFNLYRLICSALPLEAQI